MTCRAAEGGTPACRLGQQCESALAIEIRGKSLASIENSRFLKKSVCEKDEMTREYDLCLVMEAPDKYDSDKGAIGFGNSFEKLIDLVKKSPFSPDRVFVTYLVKCKPPKRKPTVQEIKSCMNHLQKEILQIKPKVIMPLGATALRMFSLHNKGGLNVIRGQAFHLPLPTQDEEVKYHVVPSYDPAFFNYSSDPLLERRVLEDYRTAYTLMMTGKIVQSKVDTKYEVIRTLRELVNFSEICKEAGFFAFDTESRALPWSREPLICFSFSLGEGKNYLLPWYQHDPEGTDWKLKKFWSPEHSEQVKVILKDLFEDPELPKGAHNLKYDMNVIRKWLGIRLKGFTYDSMLMHHLLLEQKPHGLEYLADLEFGIGDYSAALHEIVGRGKVLKATYDHIPDDMLWKYAVTDAECCWRLCARYAEELHRKPHLWKLYCDEVEPLTHTLADAEWHGHYVDTDTLDELKTFYKGKKGNLLKRMRLETYSTFNPSSNPQVQQALITAGFKKEITDPLKASGYSTGSEILGKLKEKSQLASDILEYRNTIKMLGTYIENVYADLDKDGRVRYFWMIHGTESGRLSCRFYHQIPRVDKQLPVNLRDMLAAPPGKKLVYFDYSQIELRVLAILANDKEMLRLYREGADIHQATAATILGIPEEKVSDFNRQNCGKNVNFGLAYGSEGYQLVKTGKWEDSSGARHPITWDMLDRGMVRFRERFTGLATYLESVPALARAQKGLYATPFGRERRIGPKIHDREEGVRKAAEREVTNYSIQSPAGAITVRTLNLVHSWIMEWRENGLAEDDLFLVNTVHDSAVWEVADPYVEWFKGNLSLAAERPIPELGGQSFPADIGVGQNWTLAEKDSKK